MGRMRDTKKDAQKNSLPTYLALWIKKGSNIFDMQKGALFSRSFDAVVFIFHNYNVITVRKRSPLNK